MASRSSIAKFIQSFGRANRYSHFFAMSDCQLAARGLDRDGLTRAFLTELSGR